MNSLSVIIITKNAADHIESCLKSVQFADEIIILDSGSNDDTVAICHRYTPLVYSTDWPGYGPQKNRALEKCTRDWVLSIDADEVVSDELASEIKNILKSEPLYTAYMLERKSSYCKQFLAYGDWRNDFCIRLFKKGAATFSSETVHEGLTVQGKIGKLKGHLLHYSFTDLEEVLQKMNLYSSLSAKHKAEQGHKSSLMKAIIRGAWTFFRGYILKGGFLDGKKGFMLAVSNAEGCYYRYLKIMLLQSRP